MRLFTGLGLPPRILSSLAPKATVPQANLHITTKFIGEWPEERIPEILLALERIPRNGPLPLRLNGTGILSHALVAWIASPELTSLARLTEAALVPLGIPAEERSYKPHITLARGFKGQPDDAADSDAEFEAEEFYLYESKSGAYSRIATFPLKYTESSRP